jgi:sialic acid synthase SpsE
MCTVFSPEMLIYLLPMIDTIKIASSDMEYMEMIDIAIKSEKDLYLSTGGHNQAEIQRMVNYIGVTNDYMTLFYCESEYPTFKTDFRKLSLDPFLTYERIGLSDHSKEVYSTIIEARDYGISVIEKHVNFCHYKDTADAGHSLGFTDFELMIKAIRGEYPKDMLSPGEREMRLRHNRRLVVLKYIKAGEYFAYGKNFGCYRSLVDSLDHTSPFNYDKIDSTKSLRDYKPGDII